MLRASVVSFGLGILVLLLGAGLSAIPVFRLTFEASRVIFFLLLSIAVLTFIFSLSGRPQLATLGHLKRRAALSSRSQ